MFLLNGFCNSHFYTGKLCIQKVFMYIWCGHNCYIFLLFFLEFQINSTENRSVLHVALRAPRDSVIQSDGKNVVPDVWNVLDKIKEFSERIRSGSWVINWPVFCTFLWYMDIVDVDLKSINYIFVGWSYRKGIEGCCCCWYWWQFLRSIICAHSSSNRLLTHSGFLVVFT